MFEMDHRPYIRTIFMEGSKRLQVSFYTSNIPKFLQARVVFERAGLALRHFETVTDPYDEDYSLSKQELLANAIRQVVDRIGSSSMFFVEDTSVRIEALSESGDYPGLAVKEWFQETQFSQLDFDLINRGNNRSAVVKSDIALYIPGLDSALYFHGETSGQIASNAPSFEDSIEYPWLSASSFNGWFIPDGAEKRLGEMSLDESWSYDFRVRCLTSLVNQLEFVAVALNLPPSAYERPKKFEPGAQPELFPPDRPPLVVVGRTCAGKTTMSEHLSGISGYKFVEASSIVRAERNNYADGLPNLSAFEFAKFLLDEKGQDFVARRILDFFKDDVNSGIIISGLRTIEELETIRLRLPSVQVVYVEASERTRFERHVRRQRYGQRLTFSEFQFEDQQQWSLGLLRVAEDFADIRIRNEDSRSEFLLAAESALRDAAGSGPVLKFALSPHHSMLHNRLYRCLRALADSGRPMTTDQIELATLGIGKRILHNNVNKVLKNVPELASRIESISGRLSYEITASGQAYIRLMESRSN